MISELDNCPNCRSKNKERLGEYKIMEKNGLMRAFLLKCDDCGKIYDDLFEFMPKVGLTQ